MHQRSLDERVIAAQVEAVARNEVALELGRDRQLRTLWRERSGHHAAVLRVDRAGRAIRDRAAACVREPAIVRAQLGVIYRGPGGELQVVGSLPVQLRFQTVNTRRVCVLDFSQAIRAQYRELEVVPGLAEYGAVERPPVIEPGSLPSHLFVDQEIRLIRQQRAAPVD